MLYQIAIASLETVGGAMRKELPMMGVGLHIEDSAQEIVARFHAAVRRELHFEQSALQLAAPLLLRDLARSMRNIASSTPKDRLARAAEPEDDSGRGPSAEPWHRAALLVLSHPEGGIRGLVREFATLRRSLWEVLAAQRHFFSAEERRRVDSMLDEALAFAAERWAATVRLSPTATTRRAPDSSKRTPERRRALPPPPARPPPLPSAGGRDHAGHLGH